MFKSIFGFGKPAFKKRASSQRSGNRLAFESLEPRQLLAGIFFDSPSGTVTVAGGSGNDGGSFLQVDSTTFRATLSGVGHRDFTVADVDRIIFIGFGGDDAFNNGTNVEGLLLGGSGADTLRGGSESDIINGGSGQDTLFGNDGMDRIIGGFGADRIWGGTGNDRIFGGNGENQIRGDDGDDLIFGGADVDRIYGGNGIDQIFGLDGNDILWAGDGGVAGTTGTSQADLILGHDGDDTITGAGGLNVFYGGNGNDTLLGGIGENRLHGQNGNDELTGGSGNDFIAGHLGNDTLIGNDGNDFILPGQGNDTVDAGAGTDRISLSFNGDGYTLNGSDSRLITDHVFDGRDTIDGSESLGFANRVVSSSVGIRRRVIVQPIVVANSDGSNQAEFFGNATQEELIKAEVEKIFAVAGVDVDWLATNHWNNTFANVGNGGERPRSDLGAIIENGDAAGVGSSDPLVIDMYFVEIAAGFGDQSESTSNGLALIDGSGITMHVGDDLLDSDSGIETIAKVAAHEIGHNLGLAHVDNQDNLLGQGTGLDQMQISTVLDSQLTRACDDTGCQCPNCLQAT